MPLSSLPAARLGDLGGDVLCVNAAAVRPSAHDWLVGTGCGYRSTLRTVICPPVSSCKWDLCWYGLADLPPKLTPYRSTSHDLAAEQVPIRGFEQFVFPKRTIRGCCDCKAATLALFAFAFGDTDQHRITEAHHLVRAATRRSGL